MTDKSNTRTQIFIAILGGIFIVIGAIISSPHWFKYFFPEQFVEQEATQPKKTKNESSEESNDNENRETEVLTIERIELCPVSSKLPAYMYFELKNNGTKTLKNITLTLNLGRSSIQNIDVIGNNVVRIDTSASNQLVVQFSRLNENDVKSVYCLLSQPMFSSITLNGENLKFAKEYTYKEFIENEGEERTDLGGFFVFLQILIGFILIVFALYFVSMTYKFLRSKNLINWD